jgi:hypothetical protein
MEKENDLVVRQPQSVTTFNFFDKDQFETMQRVCKLFANSELVPDMYKVSEKNPLEKAMANCMIAIEMAQRIGASPLMIMQNMVIIYGRPSWSSKFLIATVNTCGRFNPLQYRFTEKGVLGKVDYTEYEKVWDKNLYGGKGGYRNNAKTATFDGTKVMDIECVAFTTAKGSDKVLESSPISIRLAIQEGWYTKAGSKWQTMPKQMLMYRAASFWTNAYAPELSMGMKTEDEIRDIVDIDYEDVTNQSQSQNPKEYPTETKEKEILGMSEEEESSDDVFYETSEEEPDSNAEQTSEPQPEKVENSKETPTENKEYKKKNVENKLFNTPDF